MTRNEKRFTPAEANRTLPLVRRIVADILAAGRNVSEMNNHEPVDRNALKTEMDRLKLYMNELESLGCYYKDWNFEMGLVDFPALINGRDVLLCWRGDEEEIRYYHGPEGGYATRRKIPEHLLAPDHSPVAT